MIIEALAVLFFLTSSADVVFTALALGSGGRELNPLFRELIEINPGLAYAVKLGVTLALMIGVLEFQPTAGLVLFPLGIAFFGYAAYHNYRIWRGRSN